MTTVLCPSTYRLEGMPYEDYPPSESCDRRQFADYGRLDGVEVKEALEIVFSRE